MSFKPGDRVQLLDEALEGTVEAVRGTSVLIRTTDGFPMEVSATGLVRLPEAVLPDFHVPEGFAKAENQKPGPTRRKGKKGRQAPALEVDLHLEKLLPVPAKLNPYEALDVQLDAARGQLEFALRKRIQRVVFIHGVGQGVLKAELDTLLRRYDGLKVAPADPREYGQGATEVWIPQELFS
ncbi:DNA mismatch repair protein MutS [Robiginitalea sp. M366]|uniref:Smr/MutS family protein n=1 Tax=Robiginitalea aestuariiviva TaxID=3036903 RepID=UPI00240DF2B3|nr:Smr/MutS family protein [Robiginitalea aestuariiviva]MDG1572418.1 DNA mismatch repair protein MutS [Robiginitalea aestuariiviva]